MRRKAKTDIKAAVLENIRIFKDALADVPLFYATDAALACINAANKAIDGISEKLEQLTDIYSAKAAMHAKTLTEQLALAVLDICCGSHNMQNIQKGLDSALTAASEWLALSPAWWSRAARPDDVPRADSLPAEIIMHSQHYPASMAVAEAIRLIKEQTERLGKLRDTVENEIGTWQEQEEQLINEREEIIAGYQAALIDAETTKEKISDIANRFDQLEDKIARLTRYDAIDGNLDDRLDKLKQLLLLIEKVDSLYLSNLSLIMKIKEARITIPPTISDITSVARCVCEALCRENITVTELDWLISKVREILHEPEEIFTRPPFDGSWQNANGASYGSPMTPKAGVLASGSVQDDIADGDN